MEKWCAGQSDVFNPDMMRAVLLCNDDDDIDSIKEL